MPRVTHVKSARKDYPDAGIAKGDSYYWWKFRYGGKRMSKTRPRASQLTQSEHYQLVYSTEEQIADTEHEKDSMVSALDDAYSEIENWKDELEDRLSNVENAFPNGSPVIDTLQTRVDAMETLMEEIEQAKDEVEQLDLDDLIQEAKEAHDGEDDLSDEDAESEAREQMSQQIDGAVGNIGWDVGE